MAPFFGVNDGEDCGFLATPAWKVLQKELGWQPQFPTLLDIVQTAWAWHQRHPEGYAD